MMMMVMREIVLKKEEEGKKNTDIYNINEYDDYLLAAN